MAKKLEAAKSYQDDLPQIKKNIEQSYDYFKPNYDRYHDFRRFVFDTSLSDADISLLKTLQKPQIEFNILEAYVSRLRGEFAKQEPSISVRSSDGAQVDGATIDTVEGYMRSIIFDANNNQFEYDVYTDLLSGGFSTMKVWTEFANDKSFNQLIKIGRVYDPTLCGFDPLARLSHKADARFAYEAYPKTKDELDEMGIDVSQIRFTRNVEGVFSWSYSNGKDDIALICDYYVKKKKPTRIVQVANSSILMEKRINPIMTMDDYKTLLETWDSLAQPPVIVNQRKTDIQKICRYRLIESKVIEYVETDYKYLPLIFVDGNSILLKDNYGSEIRQMTRPYVYHAKGTQKLKNFAGQTLANELENMVQHKWKVPKEGIPPEYVDAYTNPQQASVIIYNQFNDNDPNVRLDPPMEIGRMPTPPEVANTFQMSDQVIQNVLGSYDASLGINDNQLSGVAIIEAATQSNAAAMPYVVGFLNGLNQAAQIIVDLIPKYCKTPRTIPVVGIDGKRDYVVINQQGGVNFNYSDNALEVKVEAGVNFAIQKSRALQQIIALMQASPLFAQFMNQMGLEVLLDNVEMRGIDQLKVMAQQFMQQQKMQQQMQMKAQQQAMANNPTMMKVQQEQQKIAQTAQQNQVDNQLRAAEIANDAEQNQIDKMKIMLAAQQAQNENIVQMDKANTEKYSKAVDLALSTADMHHQHSHDKAKLAHEVIKSSQQQSQPSGDNSNV
jgi:hypothetical protein